jgi:phospholipase C
MKRFEALILLSALVIVAGCSGSVGSTPVPGPSSSAAPAIQHIVIMVEENRSFDNLFAGFPGANTTMQGLCKPSPPWCKVAREVPLRPIKLESTGTPNLGKDIDHSHHGFEIECDKDAADVCQNDGFDLINKGESGEGTPAKLYPYAYIERNESKPYWDLAEKYALADDMFSTDTASSFIAHQEILSGTVRYSDDASLTDQPNFSPWGCDAPGPHSGSGQITWTPLLYKDGHENSQGPFPCFTQYKTIADLLDPANVSYRYYVDAIPNPYGDFSGAVWNGFDAIKKFRYGRDWKTRISSPNTTIFSDLKAGKLQQLSFVVPSLYDSDHPASGCNGGPWWVTKVINAIGTSQYWKNTAIILFWDDWGGFYDNVPPPQINYTSLGFRVPLIVISPFAKPHSISHTEYNIGSILKFIEQTFGLGSLGTTDASANSLSDIFNVKQTPNKFTPAPLPAAMPCKSQITNPSAIREIIENSGIPE